ncbi:MAG: crossover junction endodeoxyribonuclease RuvC [Phycisphaerae bacterium]|nr:crossover junction endodeoxyribonuclease RuvC [Phycisphaerales bacterium]
MNADVKTDFCGIDPGLGTTGYAIVRVVGGQPRILDAGVFRPTASLPLSERLVQLADDFSAVIDQYHPSMVGVEELYSHYKHPRTAIQMGHARGVLLSIAGQSRIPVVGMAATRIKRFLTGNGRASKVQVQAAIQATFGLSEPPEPNDVADAIAIAYCCAFESAAQMAH